jgi:hypothetical protein
MNKVKGVVADGFHQLGITITNIPRLARFHQWKEFAILG